MKADGKIKIFYFDRTDGGACDYYRAISPLTILSQADSRFKIKRFSKADVLRYGLESGKSGLFGIAEADIVLIPRLCDPDMVAKVKELNPKAKTVLDYDDNLFKVSPLSPHYVDHGTEDVTMVFPDGKKLDVWVDGKNIDIKTNKANLEQIKTVMGLADLVTVTTEILADAYKPYAKNVQSLPNCVDDSLWKRAPLRQREDVRMGWFGGHSHYEDWTILSPVLPKVMKDNPQLKLVIMGTMFPGTVKDIPADRIEFHPWVPTQAYPYKAAILDLDFSVIPLRDNDFNKCKSNIKWVEMGSLEVPCATSYVSPYAEHAEDGNGVWIEDNDVKGWIDGIHLLANDPKLRSQIGAEARRTVMDKFEIHGQAHRWGDVYKGIL